MNAVKIRNPKNLHEVMSAVVKPFVKFKIVGAEYNALGFFLEDIGAIKLKYHVGNLSTETVGIELLCPLTELHTHALKFLELNDTQKQLYVWEADRCFDLLRGSEVPKRTFKPVNLKGLKLWNTWLINSNLELWLGIPFLIGLLYILLQKPELLSLLRLS